MDILTRKVKHSHSGWSSNFKEINISNQLEEISQFGIEEGLRIGT